MTVEEKIQALDHIDDIKHLTNQHFQTIKELALDNDAFVRSRCAALLVNFRNSESMYLLLQMGKDSDPFVRTEAYDSLSVFGNTQVEKALHDAIETETDYTARGYAILSWAEVVVALDHQNQDNINFIKHKKLIEKADICSLDCCYALYIFGEAKAIDEILSFLLNDDYHIRCAVINILEVIVNSDNQEQIESSIKKLIETEQAMAVKDQAEHFLENI